MPETPIDPAVLPGTSFANILRANYVGGAVHKLSPGGLFLNPAAFAESDVRVRHGGAGFDYGAESVWTERVDEPVVPDP